MAEDLDRFFSKIPQDNPYHIELRTEAYLSDPVFEVLKKHEVGLVFSHWTWLPPLRKQFAKVNKVFFNSGKQVVIRLMTPLRMSYEESYVRAFPFNKMVDGMLDPEMMQDISRIVNEAVQDYLLSPPFGFAHFVRFWKLPLYTMGFPFCSFSKNFLKSFSGFLS